MRDSQSLLGKNHTILFQKLVLVYVLPFSLGYLKLSRSAAWVLKKYSQYHPSWRLLPFGWVPARSLGCPALRPTSEPSGRSTAEDNVLVYISDGETNLKEIFRVNFNLMFMLRMCGMLSFTKDSSSNSFLNVYKWTRNRFTVNMGDNWFYSPNSLYCVQTSNLLSRTQKKKKTKFIC